MSAGSPGPGTAGGSRMPTGSGQLPLALRYPPDQRLETYVGAPPGVVAQVATLALQGLPGDGALFLAGAPGTGKSHLALAACAAAEAAGRGAAFVPLAAVRGRCREALDGLEAKALVALDDLQAIVGARDDEIALFDLHNRARAAGTALLYTADTAPATLQAVLPDLRSRLAQCTLVPLVALDDDGRRAVLQARARRRGLVLEDAALDWLMRRSGRDLAALTAALDRLDHASLAAQRRVTVPFLRAVLDPGTRPG